MLKMRWALSSRKIAALLAAFFVVYALESSALSPNGSPQSLALDPQPLTISTQSGEKSYIVEIADTNEEREIGLMYRAVMAKRRGMLFDFGVTRTVTMWMKNTYTPLDIIFISENSKIVTIRENTEPLSLSIISSGVAVRFALELTAGSVKADGLQVGDVVQHRVIDAVPGKK